eukprot:TRINITY_DN1095_c2_g1_i2.p2 TRINITY_DN1095_c2_g1~~TRINITY_DN1095_c2_g1_i2.p2  ORF type:complete len:183 (+),score=71.08 TRINITY_DN1095_c2_g1_i2:770-1318(+)
MSIDPKMLGEGAATVYRAKGSGKELDYNPKEQKENPKKELTEEQQKWGRGIVQSEAQQEEPAADSDEEEERNKKRKREEIRMDDPLLDMMRKDTDMFDGGDEGEAKKDKKGKKEKKSKKEKKEKRRKEKEFAESAATRQKFYDGISPANRFGIRAGYMWDGIDRSNGFEGKVLTMITTKERE